MRIEAIDVLHANLPLLGGAWGDQIHHVTHIEVIVADVHTDTGLIGTGFSYTSGVGGATIRTMIERDIAPFVIGAEVSPRGLWHRTWHHLHDLGGGGLTTTALAALDIACWDLVAKEVRKPLVDVLGRCRERVPVYASGINLNKTADELVEQVRSWRAEGYPAVKVKVGKPDIEEDVERLVRVKEVAGRMPVMVDANQGWDVGKAARAINAYEPLALHWVEEPLLCDDVAGHARLRQLVKSPIALGEYVYTIQQFNHFLAQGACDFVQADVVRVGGITPWLEIAALARAWNVPMAPHFMMELSGQVLCCIPNGYIVEEIKGGSFTDLEALADPMRVANGSFEPRATVGHGIAFDRDYLRSHQIQPT